MKSDLYDQKENVIDKKKQKQKTNAYVGIS
jgi:hypothetical protein